MNPDKTAKAKEWPIHKTAPKDFPHGFINRRGFYYKTDKAGHVIEVRNIFGCDITSWLVDPDEVKNGVLSLRKKQERYFITLKTRYGDKEGCFIYKRDNETKEEKWLEISRAEWDSLFEGRATWTEIKNRAIELAKQYGLND